jgi:hypothetical protein
MSRTGKQVGIPDLRKEAKLKKGREQGERKTALVGAGKVCEDAVFFLFFDRN